jgi:hypothetical protein
MPASPCIMPSNPSQAMSQLQALHGNGVMLWTLCVPTCWPGTERHHACAQRGTLSEPFCYAFPQMATAQRQYVYVSVLT